MHISDGILTDTLAGQAGLLTTSAVSLGLLVYSVRKIKPSNLPKTALLTAVFFVGSLLHFKFGFSSLHLVLTGLMGAVLGWLSVPAMFIGLLLQAIFFGHGGITVLGVNLFNFSCGALLASLLFRLLYRKSGKGALLAGFAAGSVAVLVAAAALAVEVALVGEDFEVISDLILVANLPLAVVEGLLTAFTIQFLVRVRPEMLAKAR